MSRPAFQPALHSMPHGLGAFVQCLRDTLGVLLNRPFFVWQTLLTNSGSVLLDEHKPHIVHVCKHLGER